MDAVGCVLANSLNQKLMTRLCFRLPLRPPLPAAILEVTDQLLLLGIDGNDRLLLDQCCLDQIIDVTKLGVSIWMAVAFSSLAIALQAEVQLVQQLTNHGTTDRMTLRAQFRGEPTHAPVGPAQWRLRIAARRPLNHGQQTLHHSSVTLH